MAKARKYVKQAEEAAAEEPTDESEPVDKVKNFARGKGSTVLREAAAELYIEVRQAFENKKEQSENIDANWNIYNCVLDENQQYVGFTDVFNPIVSDAVNARARRRVAQLFPSNNVHLNALTTDVTPFAHMALLEHYIRETQLREVVKQDLIAGDITGNWCLLTGWETEDWSIIKMVRKQNKIKNSDGVEIDDPTDDDYADVEEEEVTMQGPTVEPFPVNDLAVIPPTCNDLKKATHVAIKLRLSLAAVQKMLDKGWLTDKDADDLMTKWDNEPDSRKKMVEGAGIRVEGNNKYALVYMVWTKLPIGKKGKRQPAVVFYTGEQECAGIIRNPNWSGRPDVHCAAVDKLGGSFWGRAKMEKVKPLQYLANDTLAIGSDSTKYSLMPVTMVDPLTNPNWQSMTLGLGAVWAADPNKTKMQQFPSLWREAIEFVVYLKQQIWESMDVNEVQMGRSSGRKNNQQMAAAAAEANIPITDDARRYEDTMLEPLMEAWLELDVQYRREDLTIVQKGEIGVRAKLEVLKPQQLTQKVFIDWMGTEYQKSLQLMQQQIAWINVLRGVNPQQLNGRRLDITPALEKSTLMLFGAEVAPQILIDERDMFTIDPEQENEMIANGLHVECHPIDDDPKHLQAHMAAAQKTGDPSHGFRAHIGAHLLQMQKKAQASGQASPPGQPGVPGGAGPGVAGTPKQGALPGAQRNAQAAPGAIHTDQVADQAVVGRE